MTTLQTEYTEAELLAGHPITEPLVAGGVRCHGGFDENGAYVSPRTLNRVPAIEAWQQLHNEQFGKPLLDLPLETWPEHYPNVAQAKYLITEDVREPLVSTLTRIGTVEGFGAMIRESVIPDLTRAFDEDVTGTAMAHLGRGLFEAHGRDEAGFEDEGGHKQMWFAARDIAFEHPVTDDDTDLMIQRMMGLAPGQQRPDPQSLRLAAIANRAMPSDIDFDLESLVARMVRILLIEIQAFHAFAWAEDWLSDTDLVAGDGEAARLVSFIRRDETPHVGYLETVLSEMRDRTFVGESGRKYPGTDLVGLVWDRALEQSLGAGRQQGLQTTLSELEHALEGNARKDDILEGFHAVGSVRPAADGEWVAAEPITY